MPILVVDDNSASLLALAEVLAPLGEPVVTTNSAREALRLLPDHRFALILLDVQMPEMDGVELAALIRERETYRSTPIIFLTAADESQDLMFAGYQAGAVDFLHQPVNPEVLRAKVSAFVAMARSTQRLEDEAAYNSRVQQSLYLAQASAEAQLDQERDQSRKQEAFLQAVLESLTAAVVACSPKGEPIFFNRACSNQTSGVPPTGCTRRTAPLR